MKRLGLVLTVLLLGVAAAFASDATATTATTPWQDYNPNPYEQPLAAAEKALKDAYTALEKLYNSFNFDQLISSYYAYAKCLSTYEETKKRFDAFETAYPFKLVLRVQGLDLRDKAEVDYPVTPNEIEANDDRVVAALPPCKVGVAASVQIDSNWAGRQMSQTFKSNADGVLPIRHFGSGQHLKLIAKAEGYEDYTSKLVMDKSKKKIIRLEVLSGSLTGLVQGLPKLNVVQGTTPAPAPLAGAKLTFVHTQTKKTYTAITIPGNWPFPRRVPPFLKPLIGKYFINRMYDGEYTCTVTKDGFRPFTNKLVLKASKEPQVQNFVLVPMFDAPLANMTTTGTNTTGTSTTGTGTNNTADPLSSEQYE